jgi:FlaA1/EpsC-like NDP-sugar epimerase
MASVGTKLSPQIAFPAFEGSPERRLHERHIPFTSSILRLRQSGSVVADLTGMGIGTLLTNALRSKASGTYHGPQAHGAAAEHIGTAVLCAVLIVLFCHTQRLYSIGQSSSWVGDTILILRSVLMATLILGGCLLLSGVKSSPLLVVPATGVSALLSMSIWRYLRRQWLRSAVADGLSCRNVLIVGTDTLAQAVAKHLDLQRQLGFVVVGHLSVNKGEKGPKILGSVDQIEAICRANFVDEIIVCVQDRGTAMGIISDATKYGVGVRVIPTSTTVWPGVRNSATWAISPALPSSIDRCPPYP